MGKDIQRDFVTPAWSSYVNTPLDTALPEETWPDMSVVEAKVRFLRNRSEKWAAEQK